MEQQVACRTPQAGLQPPFPPTGEGTTAENRRPGGCDRTGPWLLLFILCCLTATLTPFGGVRVAHAQALAPVAQPDNAPPRPADAMLIYGLVDRWIRQWNVPETPPDYLPAVHGACVTLRLEGEIIGRGEAFGKSGLWRALRQAYDEASARMTIDRDALFRQRLEETAGRITISLELAGPLIPLSAKTLEAIAAECVPGLDGVAIRAGTWEGSVFPGRMLAFSQEPAMAVSGLLTSAREAGAIALADGPDPTGKALTSLIEQGLLRVHRFRVTHVAQVDPRSSPMFLSRGGRDVSLKWASRPAMRALAQDMGLHLAGRMWPGVERFGLMGRYLPAQGRFAPELATPAEQGLAAYAMLRLSASDWLRPDASESIQAAAIRVLEHLAFVEPGEPDPLAEAGAAGLIAGALVEAGPERIGERPETAELLVRARRRLLEAYSSQSGFAQGLAEGERGVVAWGLGRLASAGGVHADVAASCVRQAFAASAPEALVTQMPFLAWAELDLRGEHVPTASGLRQLRSWAWRTQVGLGEHPDEAGGLRLVHSGAARAMPTWATARLLAALGRLARDPRVTDSDEALLEVARLLDGARFLRQLTADDALGHMYVAPARATGGVRAALFDQRMPPDATSMSLLAILETLEAIDALDTSRSRPRTEP